LRPSQTSGGALRQTTGGGSAIPWTGRPWAEERRIQPHGVRKSLRHYAARKAMPVVPAWRSSPRRAVVPLESCTKVLVKDEVEVMEILLGRVWS
jgi:hypothetical protein